MDYKTKNYMKWIAFCDLKVYLLWIFVQKDGVLRIFYRLVCTN